MVDPQTAIEVGKSMNAIRWPEIIIILSFLIPIYIWVISEWKKAKAGGEVLTKTDLKTALEETKPSNCLFNKKLFDDVEDRILENKDILRDVVSQLKTEESSSKRIEDNIERVRKNLTDLTEILSKIVR